MQSQKLSKKINGFMMWATAAGMLIAPWIMYGRWFWELTGPSVIMGFAISALLVIPIALSIVELCTMLPATGGSYLYGSTAFGQEIGFVAAWFSALSYHGVIASSSTMSVALLQLLGVVPESYQIRVVVGAITVLFYYILSNMKVDIAMKVSTFITVGLLICGVVINGGLLGLSGAWHIENFSPFFTKGWSGFISSTGILITLYFGFEAIPQFVEEVNIPVKKMAVLLLMAVGTAWAIYTIAFVGIAGVVSVDQMLHDRIAPATIIIEVWNNHFIGQFGFLVAIGITILGAIAAGNGFWIALSRLYYSLGCSRVLPLSFSRLNKNQVPSRSNLLVFIITFVLVTSVGDKWLELLYLINTLSITIVFTIACASFIKMRIHHMEWERPLKLPGGISIGVIGLISSIFCMYCAATQISPRGWLIFGGYCILGGIFLIYNKVYEKRKIAIENS